MSTGAAGSAVEAPIPSVRTTQPKPEFVVKGGMTWLRGDMFRELWAFRGVLAAFVVRHVKVKYKQASIGIGWTVLQPIAGAGLFALFLGRFAKLPSDHMPYLVFALAGLVAWTTFASMLSTSMESLISDQTLLRKVYFPREVLPLATVGAGLVDFVPAIATLIVVAVLFGLTPALTWLLLPVPVLLLALAATALGLAMSALNVYYRDVRYALPFLLQLGLFASPVVYPVSAVPEQWRTAYTIVNPVAAAIDALRRIIGQGAAPLLTPTIGAFAWSLLLLVAGYMLFKRLERGFSDRI